MCLCESLHLHKGGCARGCSNRVLGLLELEIQVVVSILHWCWDRAQVLWKSTSALNHFVQEKKPKELYKAAG